MTKSNRPSRMGIPLGPRSLASRLAARARQPGPPLLSFSQENFHEGEPLRLTLLGGFYIYQLGDRDPVQTECQNARQATTQARKDLCP